MICTHLHFFVEHMMINHQILGLPKTQKEKPSYMFDPGMATDHSQRPAGESGFPEWILMIPWRHFWGRR
jgi:hypothetical protein